MIFISLLTSWLLVSDENKSWPVDKQSWITDSKWVKWKLGHFCIWNTEAIRQCEGGEVERLFWGSSTISLIFKMWVVASWGDIISRSSNALLACKKFRISMFMRMIILRVLNKMNWTNFSSLSFSFECYSGSLRASIRLLVCLNEWFYSFLSFAHFLTESYRFSSSS